MSDTLDELANILQQIEQMQGGTYIESVNGYREVKRLFAKARECIEKLRNNANNAQKILGWIEKTEEATHSTSESKTAQAFYEPVDDIKGLCQEELNKHD